MGLTEKDVKTEVPSAETTSNKAVLLIDIKSLITNHLDEYGFDPYECTFKGIFGSDDASLN